MAEWNGIDFLEGLASSLDEEDRNAGQRRGCVAFAFGVLDGLRAAATPEAEALLSSLSLHGVVFEIPERAASVDHVVLKLSDGRYFDSLGGASATEHVSRAWSPEKMAVKALSRGDIQDLVERGILAWDDGLYDFMHQIVVANLRP